MTLQQQLNESLLDSLSRLCVYGLHMLMIHSLYCDSAHTVNNADLECNFTDTLEFAVHPNAKYSRRAHWPVRIFYTKKHWLIG